ncbi:F-box protein At3g07870-like [Corylus avellana]|uniref:F-box protein At3g07870-like n=1 Tax=Corylus avellana TaxID=13451 RepID=UPI001E1F08B1|nr:F-box protein At3g07870-like [Corylus avellana]XP_059458070.1 F-box protein At3g07870-like [Corylus avellana]
MSTSLPADVVVEILSRLPPKSLLRFRCVSKTWLALIGSHDFFSRNLLNDSILTPQNSSQPLPLILVKATDKSDAEKLVFYSLSYDTLDCVSQIPMNLPPGPVDFLIRPNFYLKLVGSCNGLLCLYNFRSRDVYLWKPTTPSAEFKAIPPLSPHPFSVGFGFDPKSGDFKVVSLRYVADGTETSTLAAEVYSMSRGSWKRLDLRVPYGIFAHSQTLALGGVFLWLAEQNNGQIISFDFSDEVFRTTTLPYTRDALGSYHQLMELNGYVAMALFPLSFTNIKMSLEIWVLLEFGVKESWIRFVSIEPPMDLERRLGFWKNGKLFMENSEGQLVLYDPFTQTKKNLQIEGLKESFEVVLYTQSSSVAINGGVDNL